MVVEIVDLVRQATSLADATDFVNRLEYGFGTIVGPNGNLMSGGQKQRISLARALIRDPKILILDEATASLDSASEQRIQTAIERIAEGRTLISIAHRLSTIRNADNIIVPRDGRILEQGSHAELLSQNGPYAGLVQLQSLEKHITHDKSLSRASTMNDSIDHAPAEKISSDQIVATEEYSNEKGAVKPSEETPKPGGPDSKVEEEGMASDRSVWSIVKNLAPIARPYLLWMLVAFFASTIVGSSYSAEAIIFGNTVGSLSPCKSKESIISRGNLFGLLFFVLAIVEFFANLISWSAFGWVAEKMIYNVRVLSFRALFEQDLQWHQSLKRNPAMLLSFITRDGNALSNLTGSVMGTTFSILVN